MAPGQVQVAFWHVSGEAQIDPGQLLPQWFGSVDRSTQPMPAQLCWVAPHAQPLSTQACPTSQAMLQPPQLFGSPVVSTHEPVIWPGGMQ